MRNVGQIDQRGFGNAVGPVSAAREPHGIDRRIGHHLAQGRQPSLVRPGEMALGEEALRMDDELAVAAALGNRRHRFRGLPLQRATGGDHRDAHDRL